MDIDTLCRAAVKAGASDIHLKAGLPPMVRINGSLMPIPKAPVLSAELIGKMAWAMMKPTQREHFKASPDLDLAYQVKGIGRFRVNVFRARGNVGMVLRSIPGDVKAIGELGLPAILARMVASKRGLILLTGSTGSGKSTTLAAMIEEINRTEPQHIVTIEDPIEFSFRDKRSVINQREVGSDSKDFATALRAALRQDPDTILLGELRDAQTMEIALRAAETGHLVMGTLHTINATEAIQRVTNFFEPHHQQSVRHMLAGVLVGIVSQRLVPRKGGGRVAVIEVMRNVGAVTECIEDPKRLKEIPDLIVQGTAQYATQSFDQSLYWAHQEGLVEMDVLLRYASNPDDLQLRLSGISSEEWNKPD